jgi:hypothetical protein
MITGWSYLIDVRLVMGAERIFLKTQFATHFCKCAGDQSEPPFFIGHAPQYFGVRGQSSAIVHVFGKVNLFFAIAFS